MKKVLVNIALLLIFFRFVEAGTTGKISGTVIEKKSKEPVINALIHIKELNASFSVNSDGFFSKMMIPPGTYSIQVTAVGYKNITIPNVVVQSDKTTKLSIELEETPIVGETVTATSQNAKIKLEQTSSIKNIDTKSYENMPGMRSFSDLISIQNGVVKYGDNFHIRGGRAGEILYVLDGIPIKDILYSGSNALDISVNSIQEIGILNSGFSAEFGNAESGVINIITKSGSDNYSGSFEYQNDNISNYSNDEYFTSLSLGGMEPISNFILPFAGIEIPGRLHFFSSLSFKQTNTGYNFNDTYLKNFKKRNIDFLGGIFSLKYKDKQDNSYDGTIKLDYNYKNYSAALSYTSSAERAYRYDIAFKNRMDSALVDENSSEHLAFKWTQSLSDNLFYNIHLGLLKRNWNLSVAGLTPDKYNPVWYSQDINSNGYNELSMAQFWSKSQTNIYTIKTEFNYQYNTKHLFKSGIEFNYEEISATEIQYPGTIPDRFSPGEYSGYGEYRWNLNNYTANGSAYLQDKMEFEGLIVNAGLRADFFSPGRQVNTEEYRKAWEEATYFLDETGNLVNLEIDKLQLNLSPRFGISHPITDKSALFFNYGHFYQLPERQYIFRDPYLAKGWIGNPNLKSPKTVCYEFGYSHELPYETAITVKGFYKDYFDYIGSLEVGPASRRVFMFYNRDYANAKGFEISLNKNYSDNFSYEINYTYSTSKGRSESPFEESYSVWQGSALLPGEVRMPWDQNHTLNGLFTYYISEQNEIGFFNSPIFQNLGITFKYSYGSGFPYTPTGKNLKYSKNSATMPYTSQLDLRLEKKINLYKNLSVNVYCECKNLLNRKNVKEINPLTGKPYVYGDLYDNTNKRILTYNEIMSKLDDSSFYQMRQIFLGTKIDF